MTSSRSSTMAVWYLVVSGELDSKSADGNLVRVRLLAQSATTIITLADGSFAVYPGSAAPPWRHAGPARTFEALWHPRRNCTCAAR